MTKVKCQHSAFMKRCIEGGMGILRFPCPACGSEIETLAATRDEVWDSLSICPECNAIFMKVVNGTTVLTQSVPEVTNGKNHHHVN